MLLLKCLQKCDRCCAQLLTDDGIVILRNMLDFAAADIVEENMVSGDYARDRPANMQASGGHALHALVWHLAFKLNKLGQMVATLQASTSEVPSAGQFIREPNTFPVSIGALCCILGEDFQSLVSKNRGEDMGDLHLQTAKTILRLIRESSRTLRHIADGIKSSVNNEREESISQTFGYDYVDFLSSPYSV